MPSWKKIITSGSNAVLNEVTSSGGFSGDGSGLSNVSVTYSNVTSKPTLISGSAQLSTDISGSLSKEHIDSTIPNIISSSAQLPSGIVSASSIASSAQGQVALTTNGEAATAVDLGLQSSDSPTFAGLTTTGDVVVQGDITAERMIVSSSVSIITQSFSSGSTIFGDDSADTHQFTGSLIISGAFTLNDEPFATAVSSSAAAAGFGVGGGDSAVANTVSSSAQLAVDISGSLSKEHIASKIPNIVSSSAQISVDISGSLSKEHIASKIPNIVSGSAQISSDISGSIVETSSSLAARAATLEGTGTIQGLGTTNNVTFNKITTTSGPDVFGGNVTIAGNLTLAGSQSSADTLVIADQFGFFASGSETSNLDAGVLVQSGSNGNTGSAIYHDVTTTANTNPNGGRWSVAKNVKVDDTAVTPGAFVSTVTVGGDTDAPEDGDVQYGVGEMYITSDGEIYIYTGS